jgi:hypothetical protein
VYSLGSAICSWEEGVVESVRLYSYSRGCCFADAEEVCFVIATAKPELVAGTSSFILAKVCTFGYNVSRILKSVYLCIAANLIDIEVKEICPILYFLHQFYMDF